MDCGKGVNLYFSAIPSLCFLFFFIYFYLFYYFQLFLLQVGVSITKGHVPWVVDCFLDWGSSLYTGYSEGGVMKGDGGCIYIFHLF